MRREVTVRIPRVIRALTATLAAIIALGAACSSTAAVPAPIAAPLTLAETATPPSTDLYRDGGFLVGDGAIPFVGMVRFAATEFLDSTAVVIALSIPPRSLSFVRAGDRYAAFYSVRIDLLVGEAITRSERPSGELRVASFAETNRADEGVIFQRSIRVAPGTYTVRLTAYDSLGTGSGAATTAITVPFLSDGAVAPLIPVFTAEPRRTRDGPLMIVSNPKATARYGRDTVLELYVEGYGMLAPDTILLTARRDSLEMPLFTDTLVLPKGNAVRAARGEIPVARLGLGRNRITASRASGAELGTIVSVVTLGVDLPVESAEQLADALRYFATEAELQGLRAATVVTRPSQWAALMRRTDPNPTTPENEALLEYARRLRIANALYRDGDIPGWQTDRGAVIAALGEPNSMSEPLPADTAGTARVMSWDYRRYRLYLVFTDAAAPGRWKLSTISETDFRSLLAASGPCLGCR